MKGQRRFTRAVATSVVGVLAVVGVGWATASPAGAAAWDPFPDATAMVVTQFEDFLDRTPTPTERTTWASRLNAGTHSRGDLVEALRDSTDNLTYVDPIPRLYWTAFYRLADRPGFDYWVGQRRSGTKTLLQVADAFAITAEWATHWSGLTNTQFVTKLYTRVFGHSGDAPGVAYWVGKLDAGESRSLVMAQFIQTSTAIAALRPRVNIAVSVIAMFQRTPTNVDLLTYWNQANDSAALADLLFQNSEYHYP